MADLVECKLQSNYTLITMDDGKANALGFDMLAQLGSRAGSGGAGRVKWLSSPAGRASFPPASTCQ